jgi:autotransporter-associated beta strand protein
LASYSLTLNTNPLGAGSVIVSPLPDQGGKYAPGSVVTLTATAAGGGTFSGWTGDIVSTNNPIVLAMISNQTVTAGFSGSTTTKIWSGGSGGSGNWTTAQNWSSGTPNAGDELIFPSGASRLTSNTNDFATNTIFKSITFGGGGYVLRGNPLSLNQGIAATNASGTNTLNLAVQINSNQTFRCSAAAAGLLIAGNVALGSSTLTNDVTGTMWLGGLVSGTGGLIKQGNGTLTLSSTNTYTSQTTVSGGQLIVNGSQSASAVVVNSSGTLAGTGVVGNLSGPGTISPGSSPGVLSSGNVTFSANTIFRVELNGTTVGSGYDQLNVGGTVSLAGTLNATLGFTPAINDSFTIIDNNGNDAVVGTFAGLPQGSHLVFGGVLLQISYSSGVGANNVVLTRVAPTPPNISSFTKLANGAAQVQGTGQAGLNYVLESATTLTAPITWTPVRTNTAAANGGYQLIHSNAFTVPMRLYRVRWP